MKHFILLSLIVALFVSSSVAIPTIRNGITKKYIISEGTQTSLNDKLPPFFQLVEFDGTSTNVTTTEKLKKISKSLGFTLGVGAVALYVPIITKLFSSGNADGHSLMTWVYTVSIFSALLVYPFKKGYPLEAYSELVALSIASYIIVALISIHNKLLMQFFIGSLVLTGTYSHPYRNIVQTTY